MADSVYRVTEVIGPSSEDGPRQRARVEAAGKTVRDLRVARWCART